MTTQIDDLNNLLIEKEDKITKLFAENRRLAAEKDEAERKSVLWDRWYKEIFARHKSQLMTVYYSLDKLAQVGTHHEKEVVIRFLRMTLEGFMKEDTLPFDQDLLPF